MEALPDMGAIANSPEAVEAFGAPPPGMMDGEPGIGPGSEGGPGGMDALDGSLGGGKPPEEEGGKEEYDPMTAALDGAAAASDAGAAGGQQGPGPDTMADMPDPGAESDMPKPEEDDQGGGAAG